MITNIRSGKASVRLGIVGALHFLSLPLLAQELHTLDGQLIFAAPLRISEGIVHFVKDGEELAVPLVEIKSYSSSRPIRIKTADGESYFGSVHISNGRAFVQSRFGRISIRPNVKTMFATANDDHQLAAVYGKGKSSVAEVRLGKAQEPSNHEPATVGEDRTPLAADNKPEADLSSIREQGVLLPNGRWSVDMGGTYLRTSRGVQSDTGLVGSLQISKGLATGLEGFASIPAFLTTRTTQIGPTDPSSVHNNGIGDLRFGLKYLLNSNPDNLSQTVLSGFIQVPTGGFPYQPLTQAPGFTSNLPSNISINGLSSADIANLQRISSQLTGSGVQVSDPRDPFRMQRGSGHWGANVGITKIQTYDPVALFYGGDITVFRSRNFFGYSVQPGTRFGLTGGASFLVNDISSFTGQVQLAHQAQWELNGQRIIWSSTSPVSMRFAYTHKLTRDELIEPSISYGLTGDITSAAVTINYSRKY